MEIVWGYGLKKSNRAMGNSFQFSIVVFIVLPIKRLIKKILAK